MAERVYWIGRYMERIENIARLINVNASLLLDMPSETHVSWLSLLNIVGGEDLLESGNVALGKTGKRGKKGKSAAQGAQERAVMKLLISDKTSHCSIATCLVNARENARTTREVIPSEAWELINDLHLYVQQEA
ncbi:MAG: alpha-E domain-containing protein, partial [Halioglobus sp.]|nr:alpha-E domain-containing protein [Halioglobus sp.]